MIASRTLVKDLSAYGIARAAVKGAPLDDAELRKTHAFWRACNYLALGMIYLQGIHCCASPLDDVIEI